MRKQDRIILLIQALSQGEKKFFMQNNRTQYGNKDYLKLYELLLKKSSYDVEELCKQLNKSKTALANEKKYLEKNLLRSLRLYHESNPQIVIFNRLTEGIILTEKNIPELATAAVLQGIDQSKALDIHPLTWHGHGLMLTLCSDPFTSFNESEKDADFHLEQMKIISKKIQLTIDFEILNTTVFKAYSNRRADITNAHKLETKKLLAHRLLKRNYADFGFTAYKYSLQSLLFARLGDTYSNIEANKKLVELYEAQPNIDTIGYWNALANLTQSIIAASDKEMIEVWFAKLFSKYYAKLPVDVHYLNNTLQNFKSIFTAGAYFNLCFSNNINPVELRIFTKRFIKHYKEEKSKITETHFTSTVYKTAVCSFVLNDVEDCVLLLNKLFNEKNAEINISVFKNAKMLFILAHYQLNNFQLVDSLLANTINYLKKETFYSTIEEDILKQIQSIIKSYSVKDKKNKFMMLKKYLDQNSKNDYLKKLLSSLPLLIWIEKN